MARGTNREGVSCYSRAAQKEKDSVVGTRLDVYFPDTAHHHNRAEQKTESRNQDWYEEYKVWDSERTVRREKNKYRRLYQHFSLEQSFDGNDEQAEDWLLAAQDSVDFLVESDITTENLLKALALPFGVRAFDWRQIHLICITILLML